MPWMGVAKWVHPTRGVNQNAAVYHFAEHGGTSSSAYESKQARPKARSPVYEVHRYRGGADIDICGYTAQQARKLLVTVAAPEVLEWSQRLRQSALE